MRLDRFRLARHALVSATVAALAATSLAACGGGDDDAQTLDISVTEKGKASEFTLPESAETGLAEITLTNDGKEGHDLTLVRVEGGHSAADAIQGVAAAMEGKPFPDWFFAGGGLSIVAPGQSETVTQVLEPGTYYAFDTEQLEGPPDPKTISGFEVTGEASDEELPEADGGEIEAIDYGFKASGLTAGNNEILFANTGAQPHFIEAAPVKGDATIEEVKKAIKSNGRPPLKETGTQTTAVLEGGDSQLVTLDLKPGTYALLCFISDRQGGQPHTIGKDMIGEAEVK